MSYAHTARSLIERDSVEAINGAMEQRGLPWREDDPSWERCKPELYQAIEVALIDVDCCLDAPRLIPAGACYGVPCYEEFAVAIQLTTTRHP